MKKLISMLLVLVLALGLTAFAAAEELSLPTFDQIALGDYADLEANIKVLSHRTDLKDTKFPEYVAAFAELYPGITVEYETVTDYAQDALIRLTGGDWGDIMMFPQVDKDEYSTFFVPFGELSVLETMYNFVDAQSYEGICYGIPSTGNANGIVYNKKVFADAGIETLPTTPEEFVAALQAIADNTEAIPLYTNYAAGWTMGAWDAYIGGCATGDGTYMNQKLAHTANPFSDPGDGTHAYNVYKILYDAVAAGLIEDDYTTTDWEGCKGMINSGEIGCMVLGSWAHSQMVEAGPNGDDIGYMPFPITVDGAMYANAGGDYNYCINVDATLENQIASMLYIKWLTHESNFAYSEGGIPIDKAGEYPPLYEAFDGVEMVADAPALTGDEMTLGDLNAESTLAVNAGGNLKIQQIVEHAANGTKTFDEIMDEWNELWTDGQESLGIEVQY